MEQKMTLPKELSIDQDCGTTYLVPTEKSMRNHILEQVEKYVFTKNLTPPPSKEELWKHAKELIQQSAISERYCDFIKVLINNEIWKTTIASVPFERRLLLLPQCLRSTAKCRAEIDEFGLLCEQCGACPIGNIQKEAETLGYVVLIAEGTTVVTSLLESGKVDALIGVSCLKVLEKTFPHMVTYAIPGIAIPLTKDGCSDTTIDLDWLNDLLHMKSDDHWVGQRELQEWHHEVNSWFGTDFLKGILAPNETETQNLAISWLTKNGKRWRPFLAVTVFKALTGYDQKLPDSIKKLAVAVECFHKASLIHDDIEDEDDFRYGEATLHREHGLPVALNIGDLLIGEGYRLIANCGLIPEQISKMLSNAADGHHTLCIGQGEELLSLRNQQPPETAKVLEIFRCKTSPAFEVALYLGAVCANADDEICKILNRFSESLGIAYQIQDDLDDFHANITHNHTENIHSSILLSMAMENADNETQQKICQFWQNQNVETDIVKVLINANVEQKAKNLAEYYKNEAIRSLANLKSAPLKSMLRKVIGKIVGRKSDKTISPEKNSILV